MEGYLNCNINDLYSVIIEQDNLNPEDIDEESLDVFKQQCDLIDIVIGNHVRWNTVKVHVETKEDNIVVVRVLFDGRPPTHLTSYMVLRMIALDDRLVQGDDGQYLWVITMNGFLK